MIHYGVSTFSPAPMVRIRRPFKVCIYAVSIWCSFFSSDIKNLKKPNKIINTQLDSISTAETAAVIPKDAII